MSVALLSHSCILSTALGLDRALLLQLEFLLALVVILSC